MSGNQITKRALANAFKNFLEQLPLEKISVKDITEACHISRNTFYYHFRDKYELIQWIFYTDMLQNVNSFNEPSNLMESFLSVCKCLYENRRVYLACFQYVGQNSLYEYLNEFYCEMWKINLSMKYSEMGLKLAEADLHLMAKLKAHSIVGALSDWVKEGMKDNYVGYFSQVKTVLEFEASGYAYMSEQKLLEEPYGRKERQVS